MKDPSREYLMVIDLMLEIQKGNPYMSHGDKEFLLGLWGHLDEYLPFLEQQSEGQKKWLYKLHDKHIGEFTW